MPETEAPVYSLNDSTAVRVEPQIIQGGEGYEPQPITPFSFIRNQIFPPISTLKDSDPSTYEIIKEAYQQTFSPGENEHSDI